MNDAPPPDPIPHRRRPRYKGKYPRRFADKYKEHNPSLYPEVIAKVVASGKTPAGTHRPIMVTEVLEVLQPRVGEIGVDCTLGYGGHTTELLTRVGPTGRIISLDVDPIELPKTEERLRSRGFDSTQFTAVRSNFAGLRRVLSLLSLDAVDFILADLGVSSMQLDDPNRGFSLKSDGPLDMRLNPEHGRSAGELLRSTSVSELTRILTENSDEPAAMLLGRTLAGKTFKTTTSLANTIRELLNHHRTEDRELSVRRVFQALRIEVNDEFSALDTWLRQVPGCLRPGGRVAVLTFHSGEDRRVKKAFHSGLESGIYSQIAQEVVRPSSVEQHDNPRSKPAKLRWAKAP